MKIRRQMFLELLGQRVYNQPSLYKTYKKDNQNEQNKVVVVVFLFYVSDA